MTDWESQFQEHEIWGVAAEFQRVANGAPYKGDYGLRDTIQYAQVIMARVLSVRDHADPVALTASMLDAVKLTLDPALAEFKELFEDPETNATYSSVDDQLRAIIQAMSAWPSPPADGTASAARKAVDDITDSVTRALTDIGAVRDELAGQLNDLAKDSGILASNLKAVRKSSEDALLEQNTIWKSGLDERQAEAQALITELEDVRTQAQDILHETTSAAVGSEYGDYAKKKHSSAVRYDAMATVLGLVGLVSLALYLRDVDGEATSSLSLAIGRLGITLGALVVAGVLASRGADNHKESRDAQRTALALGRLAPFIVNLPPDAREVLTIETADRIFTRGELGEVSTRESVYSKVEKLRSDRRERQQQEREGA